MSTPPAELPFGVSYMVTVYNKRPYLEALIDSLAAQTGDFPREFVFVDDGSRDGGADHLETLLPRLPEARLHRFENGGQAAASNRGFALCRYAYVKPVDADDPLHPTCGERLLAALRARPEASLAFCDQIPFTDGEPVPVPAIGEVTPRLEPDPLAKLLRNVFANPTQIMAPLALVRAVGGCDERIRHSMEYGLSLRLALRGPFVHVPAPLATLRLGMQGNLSANQQLTLTESILAPAFLFEDNPALPGRYKRQMAIRAAKRAWLWRARKAGASAFSADSLRRLEAYVASDAVGFLRRCAAAIAKPL